MSQPNKTTKVFDYLLDPEKRQEIEKFVTQNITAYKAAFQRLDKSASLPTLFSSLWYSKLPCFDVKGMTSEKLGEKSLLKLCQWKSMTIPCSAIFTTFPTDLGMCCTFNMKAADDIFQDKTYAKRLREHQEEDKKLSFENSQPPEWFLKTGEPKSQFGISKGLYVMLDAHNDLVSITTTFYEQILCAQILKAQKTLTT
jgi:hypothetical protein